MPGLTDSLPSLLRGLAVTLEITVAAGALAVMIALAAGLARASRRRWLSWPAAVYVETFRGTSALVQLFWFYFVVGSSRVDLQACKLEYSIVSPK